ncbi:orotate phosphoribosyltransferase [Chlamydiota bacterium]
MKPDEIIALFKEKGALLNGHFILSSGLHSNEYMQCALLLQYPEVAALLCKELASKFMDERVDVVAGPALGGVIVAHELARHLKVRSLFSERKEGKMLLRRGFSLKPAERVLLVEDVITTGKSVLELYKLLQLYNCTIMGIAMLVDRSDGKLNPGIKVESLLKMSFKTFSPQDCPLCLQGIPAIKPGSRLS